MNKAAAWAWGIIAFLGGLAIFSRLVSFSGTPKVVKGAVDTGTNLFNGAFFS